MKYYHILIAVMYHQISRTTWVTRKDIHYILKQE